MTVSIRFPFDPTIQSYQIISLCVPILLWEFMHTSYVFTFMQRQDVFFKDIYYFHPVKNVSESCHFV